MSIFNTTIQKNIWKFGIDLKKEIIGILVAGSGKSTFVNLLCGLFKPQQGEIKFNNKLIYNDLDPIKKN